VPRRGGQRRRAKSIDSFFLKHRGTTTGSGRATGFFKMGARRGMIILGRGLKSPPTLPLPLPPLPLPPQRLHAGEGGKSGPRGMTTVSGRATSTPGGPKPALIVPQGWNRGMTTVSGRATRMDPKPALIVPQAPLAGPSTPGRPKPALIVPQGWNRGMTTVSGRATRMDPKPALIVPQAPLAGPSRP
jgi:hypothetical protein